MPATTIVEPAPALPSPDAAQGQLLQLNPVLRIRREQTGALVHQPRTGRVTQLSEQGLLLLELYRHARPAPPAHPFLLPLEDWHRVIDLLDRYGVFDILITGGESLLYDEFFDLAQDILGRGLRFGLSTNATILPERRLERLRQLRLSVVQVSLDGA